MWHEYILPPDACLAYPSVAWRPSTSGLRGAGPNGPGAISKRAASVKGRLGHGLSAWRAITNGDDTVQSYSGTWVVSDWTMGAGIRYDYADGSLAADGEVLAIEPGRQVTMTFHPRWLPEIDAEGPVR